MPRHPLKSLEARKLALSETKGEANGATLSRPQKEMGQLTLNMQAGGFENFILKVMNILGYIGIGAILVKILDIFWLQKIIEQSEKRKWLRDKRLKAFSELSKELLSFGLHKGTLDNPFEAFANAAEAMLLIQDKKLVERVKKFIVDLDFWYASKGKDIKQDESRYHKLYIEAQGIVEELRGLLQK